MTTLTVDIRAEIKTRLSERRPDRYTPGVADQWLDDIAMEIAPLIVSTEAQRIAARAMVRRTEGNMTRETNKILRECLERPPLDWEFFAALPLVVGSERIAIRACRAADFRQFAEEERARAIADFMTREQTCQAAEWLANQMEDRGVTNGAMLRACIIDIDG